jgi:flagellar FliJ protein
MKKFEFRLATLLKVRKRELEVAQLEFATVQEELNVLVTSIEKLRDEGRAITEELNRRQSSGTVRQVADYFHYLESLRGKITMKEDEMIKQQNVVARKREELAKAQQKTKVLENLREKQYKEWEAEFGRHERIMLDEIAVIRHERIKEHHRE